MTIETANRGHLVLSSGNEGGHPGVFTPDVFTPEHGKRHETPMDKRHRDRLS